MCQSQLCNTALKSTIHDFGPKESSYYAMHQLISLWTWSFICRLKKTGVLAEMTHISQLLEFLEFYLRFFTSICKDVGTIQLLMKYISFYMLSVNRNRCCIIKNILLLGINNRKVCCYY